QRVQRLAARMSHGMVSEDDDGEVRRREALEVRRRVHPRGEEPGEPEVLAQDRPDALTAVVPEDEPQLERAEPTAERQSVVHQVYRLLAFGRGEVEGCEGEGTAQHVGTTREQDRAVEGREQPLVRVRDQ